MDHTQNKQKKNHKFPIHTDISTNIIASYPITLHAMVIKHSNSYSLVTAYGKNCRDINRAKLGNITLRMSRLNAATNVMSTLIGSHKP